MARSYTGGDAAQKEFVKVFDSLTGRYNRWEVWRDMVWCIAIAISNRVDERYREKREKTYLDIVSKYTHEEIEKFAVLFAMLHNNIVEKTDRGDWGDFLGELFMNMGLGNNLGGQFFTPYHVCKMMARVVIDRDGEMMQTALKEKGYFSVSDCACGAGATLIAAAEVMSERGINYPYQVIFAGQDVDSTTALMCYIQLSLLGCAGYVVIGNTLSEPMQGHVLFGEDSDRCWFTPMFCEQTWHKRREVEAIMLKFRRAMQIIDGTREKPEREEQSDSVFTVSTKKKNAGQVMMDI